MSVLFEYPPQAAVGNTLPKRKLYEQAKAGTRLKDLFVAQIDKITWQFKLAPETINLPPSDCVPEIQVFRIALKGEQLHNDVLSAIDKAIPLPIIFELEAANGKLRMIACYKRPNSADSNKRVCSDYFSGEWLDSGSERKPLAVALELGSLYLQLLQPLLPTTPRADEDFRAQVNRAEQVKAHERELSLLDAKIRKEKQFNRRIAINSKKKGLAAALHSLKN